MEAYLSKVKQVLSKIEETQMEALNQAAQICTEALFQERRLFFFGTGHSHMLAEEPFYRAGGLKPIKPILETGLMLHEGEVKSTALERLEGYADILLDHHQVAAGDILFVISNSGVNAVPVEMALGAKKRGATVIALTSMKHSKQMDSRHQSGRKLFEVADLVLDNCGWYGDAAVKLEQYPITVGPTSTIAGAFMINAITVQIAKNYEKNGEEPPVYVSANVKYQNA